jgi:hypothetical protein
VILPTRNRVTGVLPEISKLDVDQSAFDPVVVTTPLEYVGDVYPPLGTVSEYPRPDLSAHAVTLLPDSVRVSRSVASNHIDSPSMSSGEKGRMGMMAPAYGVLVVGAGRAVLRPHLFAR